MKSYGKKLTALLLASCMLLGLVACGGKDGEEKKGGEASELTGTVYLPEFLKIDLDVEGINGGCSDGKNVYVIADVREVAEPSEEGGGAAVPTPREVAVDSAMPAPDTGASSEVVNYTYRRGIFRIPLDGSAPVELENYEQTPIPEGMEGDVYISGIRTGADGTLWITEEVNTYRFNLPEDFDSETGNQWDYYESGENVQYQIQLDSTGSELQRTDTTGLKEKLGVEYFNSMYMDSEGCFYVGTEGKITVLDKDMNILFEVTGENLWGELSALGDGTVGMSVWQGEEKGGQVLKTIDKTAKAWGKEYPMPYGAGSFYPGNDKYLFYYEIGDSLFGYDVATSQGTKILSWVNSNINKGNMLFFTFLEDGRILTMTRDWRGGDGQNIELAVLKETDASVLANKTTLTYATMYLDYEIRERILDFNKTNPNYRIEIRDYAEFNTAEDYDAGISKLNTEIIAGNVPDILDTVNLPIRQYGAKGLLEDLWPMIDSDPELGRDKLMTNVLEAAQQDGKLYQIFSTFNIRTVAGATKVVGDRMSWTLKDLQDALATMPEGCKIFGESDTKEGMLSNVMAQNLDSFVDWSTGECKFDTPEFIALLEFCNSFALEFDWENVNWEEWEDSNVLIQSGRQMLAPVYLYDLQSLQEYQALFGGDVSFVGYPREDGGVGSSFGIGRGMAISSTCADKEGAWSFVREIVLPRSEDDNYYYGGELYVNKADFDKSIEKAMEKRYRLDENGNQVLDENGQPIEESQGGWGWGDGQMFERYAATQADYDQFMELMNAIDSIHTYDASIFEIVNEVAGSYFNGDKTVQETASLIQNRVKLYVNEQR